MLKRTLAVTVLFLMQASNVFAVQEHVDPEGYYVHQYAHVVFIAAMVFMMIVLKTAAADRHTGWWSIRWASVFFLLWNLDALFSHMASYRMEPAGEYIKGSVLVLKDFNAKFFCYSSLIEYFFLVPAFVLLAVGVNQLLRHLEKESA